MFSSVAYNMFAQDEIRQKLFQIKVNSPWVNTLDVAVSDELVYEKSVNDDFGREAFL